jgi:hypothetical protein
MVIVSSSQAAALARRPDHSLIGSNYSANPHWRNGTSGAKIISVVEKMGADP